MFVLYACKKERNFVFRLVIFVFMSNALGYKVEGKLKYLKMAFSGPETQRNLRCYYYKNPFQ